MGINCKTVPKEDLTSMDEKKSIEEASKSTLEKTAPEDQTSEDNEKLAIEISALKPDVQKDQVNVTDIKKPSECGNVSSSEVVETNGVPSDKILVMDRAQSLI